MFKRLFDLVMVLLSAPLWVPALLGVSIVVRLVLGRPVLFCQERPGRGGKPFIIYKFRTMRNVAKACGMPLPDDQRLTSFGKFLRSTSLDELPELINVLKGEMSLVGPRPLLMEYLPLYTPEQARRHDVLPGITGWAQVNGRNAIGWEEKFKFDVWYVDNRSLLLDMRILRMTLIKVFNREGISQEGQSTMEKFSGSNSVGNRE
ncbi:MAG: sugar transferase [Desulfuromonadales bacterium]|nr:sugar transferase [Desulfuromonadales bacterium]